ncbi:hypothetical protein EH196_04035 [Bacillus sp. C1-1]|nr:hypothetical protein EH196_04035 [Bacillus sp. C1-1]
MNSRMYHQVEFTNELEIKLEKIATIAKKVAASVTETYKQLFKELGVELFVNVYEPEKGWFNKDSELTIQIALMEEGHLSDDEYIPIWMIERKCFKPKGLLDFESELELVKELEETIETLYSTFETLNKSRLE